MISANRPSVGRNRMPKSTLCGAQTYFSAMVFAHSRICVSSARVDFLDGAGIGPLGGGDEALVVLDREFRVDRQPERRLAVAARHADARISTRLPDPGTTSTLRPICSATSTCSSRPPSATSPQVPRAFTLVSTRLRSPTPVREHLHLADACGTCSSCAETSRNSPSPARACPAASRRPSPASARAFACCRWASGRAAPSTLSRQHLLLGLVQLASSRRAAARRRRAASRCPSDTCPSVDPRLLMPALERSDDRRRASAGAGGGLGADFGEPRLDRGLQRLLAALVALGQRGDLARRRGELVGLHEKQVADAARDGVAEQRQRARDLAAELERRRGRSRAADPRSPRAVPGPDGRARSRGAARRPSRGRRVRGSAARARRAAENSPRTGRRPARRSVSGLISASACSGRPVGAIQVHRL